MEDVFKPNSSQSTQRQISIIPLKAEKHKRCEKKLAEKQRLFLYTQNISFIVSQSTMSVYKSSKVPPVKETGKGHCILQLTKSMLWLMELILPGHCGSLLPVLHLLRPPVYREANVDNVFASLMRVPQRTAEGESHGRQVTWECGPEHSDAICRSCWKLPWLTQLWPSTTDSVLT